jgi:hypothetical protein
MRKFFAVVILFCFLYFLGGWICVQLSFLSREDYFAYSGIVGSFATVVGLFALTKPAITKSDFQAIELETFKSLTETAEQLKELQSTQTKTAEEIDKLALKKKEMELLVKKASLALFLKEQHSHYEQLVLDEIAKNLELRNALEKANEVSEKLRMLNEEIEMDSNVIQLKEIIAAASRRDLTLDDAINDLPSLMRALIKTILIILR